MNTNSTNSFQLTPFNTNNFNQMNFFRKFSNCDNIALEWKKRQQGIENFKMELHQITVACGNDHNCLDEHQPRFLHWLEITEQIEKEYKNCIKNSQIKTNQ